MTDCLFCNGKGSVLLPDRNGATRCPRCRPDSMEVTGGSRPGATRKTLQGMADAIVEQIQKVAYAGETKPFVFLYARPGGLPSVKVTVELHAPDAGAAVILEES